jgi:hypothetical protein
VYLCQVNNLVKYLEDKYVGTGALACPGERSSPHLSKAMNDS